MEAAKTRFLASGKVHNLAYRHFIEMTNYSTLFA